MDRAAEGEFNSVDYPKRNLLKWFAWSTVLFILLLIFVGGMVKSTNSGLSVPDWPNTYGHFMFSFPLDMMVGGIFWEHSHRMLASVAGLATFFLTWLAYRYDPRRWVRHVSLWASIAVLVQGIFGGLTVLLYLPAWTSSTHGTLAQVYLCLVLIVALSQSRWWLSTAGVGGDSVPKLRGITTLSTWLVVAILIQLMLGAVMRHVEAGLVIPDFPTMFGGWALPLGAEALANANRELAENGILDKLRLEQVELYHMILHLAHRFWAVVVTGIGLTLVARTMRHRALRGSVQRWGLLFTLLLIVQITLGILTIYTEKHPWITTTHVVVGAMLLGAAVALAASVRHVLYRTRTAPEEPKDHAAQQALHESGEVA